MNAPSLSLVKKPSLIIGFLKLTPREISETFYLLWSLLSILKLGRSENGGSLGIAGETPHSGAETAPAFLRRGSGVRDRSGNSFSISGGKS
jgi:hypothetical protein